MSDDYGVCYVTDRAGVFAINLETKVVRLITGGGWGHGGDGAGDAAPHASRLVGFTNGSLRDALFDHPDGVVFDGKEAAL